MRKRATMDDVAKFAGSRVKRSLVDLGKRAMQRLLKMIANPNSLVVPEILDIEFVFRESTAIGN